jgi:PAS domain S-box-containing protein
MGLMPAIHSHIAAGPLSRKPVQAADTGAGGPAQAGQSEQYRHLFEQASDGIFITNGEGVYLDVNDAGARMMGRPRGEIVGRRIRDLMVEEDIPRFEADWGALERGATLLRERRFRRGDGSVFQVEVSAKRLSDGRMQGILRDITARKRTEETLRQSEERFRTFTAAGFEGICISEEGRIVDANEQMTAMLGYQRDELIGMEILQVIAPEWREAVKDRLQKHEGEPMMHQVLRKDGTRLNAEAQSKTVAWQDRLLRVTALRDISEQKRTQSALAESEARLSLIFNSARDMMALVHVAPGPVFRLASVNRAYLESMRRSGIDFAEADLVRRTFQELFDIFRIPADQARLLHSRYEEVARTGQTLRYEEQLDMPGGTYSGEVVLVPIPDAEGKCAYVLFNSRDITDRRRTEAALRESEEKFSKAFRSSPDGIAISELESGKYIEVNDGCCRLFGYNREEMIGRSCLELDLWEVPAERRQMTQSLREHGEVRDVEVRSRTKSGEPKVLLVSAELIDLRGPQCMVSVVHDITDRVKAEASLRENEERFRVAAEQTGQLIYDYDVLSGKVRWAGAIEQVTGRSPAEFDQINFEAWTNFIHTDDRPAVLKVLKEATKTGLPHVVEYRFRRGDGTYLDVEDHGAFLLNENGEGRRMLGTIADITLRRRAEAERVEAARREQESRENYTHRLIASQEAERRRIAGELHDSLGQNLLLVKHRVQAALSRPDLAPEPRQQLAGILDLTGEAIGEVRRISHDLRPYQLDQLGFTRALGTMIENAAGSTSVVFKHKLEPVDDVITGDAATNLYRAAQECINNILKHAQARIVRIVLERDIHHVRLWIADDGRGFELGGTVGYAARSNGLGLKNIAERVRILGGTLTVQSEPGGGTRIEALIPISEPG